MLQYDSPAGYAVTERTRSGEEERCYYLFDRVDDMVRGVLNYHLSFARFMPDDAGKLYGIMIYSCLDHAEYLGNYSIITVSEATELLLEGRCYSSVPVVSALYLEDAP